MVKKPSMSKTLPGHFANHDKKTKYIIKRRGVVQKAEVGLSHCKDTIQNITKENRYVVKQAGDVQKAEVGLNHH